MRHAEPHLETQVTCRIDLEPDDWEFATWRPRSPRPRPRPPAFDRDEALGRLRRALAAAPSYTGPDWSRAHLAESLSPAEGHFWLYAMTHGEVGPRKPGVPVELLRMPLTGRLSRDELRSRLRQRAGYLSPLVMVPLAALLPPAELLDLLLDEELYALDIHHLPYYVIPSLQDALIEGFRRHVRPLLDDQALDEQRQRLRARVPASRWTQAAAPATEQMVGYRLAAALGLHRELAALVASWPDDLFPRCGSYEEMRRRPLEMIFGLGDAWQVEQHVRRLGLMLRSAADARAWLAHTEANALDLLRDSVRAANGYNATPLLDALCLVQAPAAARPLLELRLGGKSSPALGRWFERQVGNAVAGLLPLAAGRGKLGDAARQYLREVKRRGLADVIAAQLPGVEPAIATRVRSTIIDIDEAEYPYFDEETTPAWLRQALAELPPLPRGALPEWLSLDDLPPLVIGGRRLDPARLRTLVRALALARLDAPPALLAGVRTHAEPASRESFAWRLIESWQCAGAPERDAWALNAAGFLGGDESAHKLVALVRDATGRAGQRRTAQALDALAAIGSSLALLQLASLARQARSRPLREEARARLERLARTRGLSRGELEDAAVPSLGFEGERGPSFDYGPRSFQAVLAPGPRLLLRSPAGAVRDDLPPPAKTDDPGRARQAMADWRLLRRSLRDVLKEQSARLERAMVSGQRWSPRHFRDRILGHPILQQLARLLLWGGYDERGRLARTFRLTDDKTFVDAEERPVALFDFNSVRVVHPVELPEPARQAWTAVWRDHELIAPFPQLGRRLFPLREQDRLQTVITAFRGRQVPALTLSGLLRAQGWQPTAVGNARWGEAHVKEFRLWATTAVLHHPGVGPHAYPYHQARQELRGAYFFRGPLGDDEPIDLRQAVRLAEVHDLVRSEVCELMALLYSKGKE